MEHVAQSYQNPNEALSDCNEIQSLHNDLEPEQISQCIPADLLPRLTTLWNSGHLWGSDCRCSEQLVGCDPLRWLKPTSARTRKTGSNFHPPARQTTRPKSS